MKTQAKVALGIVVLLVAGLLGYFLSVSNNDKKNQEAVDNAAVPTQVSTPTPAPSEDPSGTPSGSSSASSSGSASGSPAPTTVPLPGDEGIVLEQGTSGVVVTEFMDFECPACAQHTALMANLLAKYDGTVTIAVRPLPLEMHVSANSAWLAALAAYEQGKFGEMYKKLFSTQQEWTGSTDQAPLFREYAEELGLDMTAYDAAVAAPATQKVLDDSVEAAVKLKAQGTPTWVVDGKIVELSSEQDLYDAVDAAVAAKK